MRYIVIALLTSVIFLPAFAQNSGLPGEEVDIVKEFNARLGDANRIVLNPELPPLQNKVASLAYPINSRVLNVQYLPPKIRPIALTKVDQGPVYAGYGKIGFGFPKTFLGEFSYDLLNADNLEFGVDINHLSSNNSEKVENQQFSNTEVLLDGTLYSDYGFAVDAQVGYKRDIVHFYGYNDLDDDFASNLTYSEDDVRQRFGLIHGKLGVKNSEKTVADIDYRAGMEFYFLEDNYAARESNFIINLGASKWIDDLHALNVDLITDFTTYKDTLNQDLHNFFLEPSYAFHSDRFRAKVGVRLASHNDEFYIYPNLEGSVNVIENILTAFVGIDGNIKKNSFRALTDYNPFLSSRNIVENSFVNRYYGGIKGEYLGIDYRAQISYEDVDNLALFLSNQDSIPRFNVLYDTANVFTLSGEIIFPLLTDLDIHGNVTYRVYDLQREDKAWHLPSLTLNAGAEYRMLNDKLKLKGDVFLENGVPVPNATEGNKNLNALLDISAGAEYAFTNQIGAFVQVNNIANNRRQRWRYYPTFGLNAVAGVTARF